MKISRFVFGAAAFAAASLFVSGSALAQPPATPAGEKPKEAQPATPAKPADTKPADAKQPATPATPTPTTEEKLVYVKMATSKGDIIIELNNEKAPISTKNFLGYVDKKFYDGTIFHRVISTFMIQGGGFTPDMKQKPTDPTIKNEYKNGLQNKRGTIAMARLGDSKPNQSTVDSATSQFFINVVDNSGLDQPQADGGAYAVFGKVISGMDAVDKIKVAPTTTKAGMQNVPVETVTITSVTRLTPEEAKKFMTAPAPDKTATPAPAAPKKN